MMPGEAGVNDPRAVASGRSRREDGEAEIEDEIGRFAVIRIKNLPRGFRLHNDYRFFSKNRDEILILARKGSRRSALG